MAPGSQLGCSSSASASGSGYRREPERVHEYIIQDLLHNL